MKKLRLPEIRNKGNVILYACILTGIVLRFLRLGMHPITAAEYSSVNFSQGLNLLQVILNNAANNNEAPLYYLITYIWTFVFGVSEISVRLLPAISGIACIFIVNKLTRSFYSEKVSVIATSLFALSPFQIYYSQQSGENTMLLIAMLLMVYYFMLSVKYNSFVIGPFTFWAIASLYCGHMSLVLLLILNIILFIRYKEEIRINLWIRSQIFILTAWLPLLIYFIKGNMTLPLHPGENIFLAPLMSLKNLLLGYTIDYNFLTIIVIAGASLFLLIGVITCRTVKEKRMTDIMSLVMFLMVILMWLGALLKRNIYADSGLLIAGVMLIIILSIGISHLSRDGMVLFAIITLTFFSISIYSYFAGKKWQAVDYRPLYMEAMRGFKDNGVIIHTEPGSYGPFEFYNRLVYKRNFSDRFYGNAPGFKGNVGVRDKWRKAKQFLSEKAGLDIYAGYDKNLLSQEELKAKAASYSRVFFVVENTVGAEKLYAQDKIPDRPDPEKIKWIRDYFRVGNKTAVPGCDMYTLERK
jgi:hypothetical protein